MALHSHHLPPPLLIGLIPENEHIPDIPPKPFDLIQPVTLDISEAGPLGDVIHHDDGLGPLVVVLGLRRVDLLPGGIPLKILHSIYSIYEFKLDSFTVNVNVLLPLSKG